MPDTEDIHFTDPLPADVVALEELEDESPEPKPKPKAKPKPKEKAPPKDDAADEEDEEKSEVKPKAKPKEKKPPKGESDDEDSETEETSADDDDSADGDSTPKKPAPKSAQAGDDDGEDDDSAPKKPEYKGWDETQVRRGFQKLRKDYRQLKSEQDTFAREKEESQKLMTGTPEQQLQWMVKNRVDLDKLAEAWDAAVKAGRKPGEEIGPDPTAKRREEYDNLEKKYAGEALEYIRFGKMDEKQHPLLSLESPKKVATSYFTYILGEYEKKGVQPTLPQALAEMERRYRIVIEREILEKAAAIGWKVVRPGDEPAPDPKAKPKAKKPADADELEVKDEDEDDEDEILRDPDTGRFVHKIDAERYREVKKKIARRRRAAS